MTALSRRHLITAAATTAVAAAAPAAVAAEAKPDPVRLYVLPGDSTVSVSRESFARYAAEIGVTPEAILGRAPDDVELIPLEGFMVLEHVT